VFVGVHGCRLVFLEGASDFRVLVRGQDLLSEAEQHILFFGDVAISSVAYAPATSCPQRIQFACHAGLRRLLGWNGAEIR